MRQSQILLQLAGDVWFSFILSNKKTPKNLTSPCFDAQSTHLDEFTWHHGGVTEHWDPQIAHNTDMCAPASRATRRIVPKHRAAFVVSTLTSILSWFEPAKWTALFHPPPVASPPSVGWRSERKDGFMLLCKAKIQPLINFSVTFLPYIFNIDNFDVYTCDFSFWKWIKRQYNPMVLCCFTMFKTTPIYP